MLRDYIALFGAGASSAITQEIEGAMIDLASRIRDVPDFPQKGILFKDITTLLKDGQASGRRSTP